MCVLLSGAGFFLPTLCPAFQLSHVVLTRVDKNVSFYVLFHQNLKMLRVSKAVQRLVGGSLQLTNGQRAVSTSARAENSLSLDMDINAKVRQKWRKAFASLIIRLVRTDAKTLSQYLLQFTNFRI